MDYKIIDVKQNLLDKDGEEAKKVKNLLANGPLLVNLMGSPGAGKTSTLVQIINRLKNEFNIGVIEADVDSFVDTETVITAGARAIQTHSGGLCHMDASMTKQALDELDLTDLDVVFLENIGNLVCPAEFDVGADCKMMILSVPEGDDKPLKYPLMFSVSDILLINKIDASEIFDFDFQKCSDRVKKLNQNIQIYPVSALHGDGFDKVCGEIKRLILKKGKTA